jgi:hypothetical protein
VVSVARVLVAVSSVTGRKALVHFVVVSEEYEKSSSLRRWMWRGPPHFDRSTALGLCWELLLMQGWSQGSTIMCARLEEVSPVAEEFELPLRRFAVGRDF